MAVPHAQPGQAIDVRPLGATLPQQQTTTLAKTDSLEIIRLVLPRDKNISEHRAPGPITLQCLEGQVEITALGNKLALEAGSLLYLEAGQPHSLHAQSDASLLLTIMLPARQR